jgi:hypothetical protein
LLAHSVFFVIQLSLFGLGYVATVLACIETFLGTDAAVFCMKVVRLGGRQFAFLPLGVDPAVLVCKPAINSR